MTIACTSRVVATPSRSLGAGEQWLFVANWVGPNGQDVLCASGGFPQEPSLRGSPDDPRLVWMVWADGHRTDLAWPVGYSARFTPDLDVLDTAGQVVGRSRTLVSGGCETQDRGVMSIELAHDASPST